MTESKAMGSIDIHPERDWRDGVDSGMGSLSTLNTAGETAVPQNPMGFIWPVDDTTKP